MPDTPQQWREAIKHHAKQATSWPYKHEQFVNEMLEAARVANSAAAWAINKRAEEEGNPNEY